VPDATHVMTREVRANWRLCVHITVEEYHVPSVHLPYWGRGGYLRRENIGYFRFGRHSAYITHPDPDAFSRMVAECRAETWRSANYRVLHIFPGFAVSHARADREHWYVSAMHFLPVAPDRTLVRFWSRLSPFPSAVEPPWYDRLLDRFSLTQRLRDRVVAYYTEKINAQDTDVCEKLQTIARQNGAAPILGRLEERIGWFEEAYEEAMKVPAPARVRSAAE
jgi:phenylpropionate dioxygenase-like ring-hydroxylating dioxygenase large terminal subunit